MINSIQSNIYRYSQIDSSNEALFHLVNFYNTSKPLSLPELVQCIERTYLYINSLEEMRGIIGVIPNNIETDYDLSNLLDGLFIYPKGKDIYQIKFIHADDDPIDKINKYHIAYQLIKQGTITLGDRPVIFITPVEDEEIFNALKANRFKMSKKDDCFIFIQYPKMQVDSETVVPY